ncbi:MAG: hypothetical protein SWO11_21115 [Thermodesulfobacteriota bacterium]|nr:hypothetical protein [Thermodesulfobacteriota bacterium]
MTNNNYITRINERLAILLEWILSHRLLFVISCIIFFIGGAYVTLSLRVDNSMAVYFKDKDSSFQFYQKFEEEYGNDEFLYIVYRIKNGVFNLDSLKITEKLVEELEGIEYVKKVSNFWLGICIWLPGVLMFEFF